MGSKTKIAVFGASGDQGQAQVRRLLASGHEVVAVARNAEPLREQAGPRLRIVPADYRDAASLRAALREVDAAFLTLPSTSFHDARSVLAAAEAVGIACRATGVRALIFNSSMIVKAEKLGFAAHDARFDIRESLFGCGVPTISIQPVIYQDNLLRDWAGPAIAQGVIRYPHRADLAVSWISQDDTADIMVAALDRPDLAGRAFNVGGREALLGPDLARRLGAVLDRPIRFESQPIEQFCARMRMVFEKSATLDGARLTKELGRIYEWYNQSPERPFFVDMEPIVEQFPVTLTSLEDWAMRQNWPVPAPLLLSSEPAQHLE